MPTLAFVLLLAMNATALAAEPAADGSIGLRQAERTAAVDLEGAILEYDPSVWRAAGNTVFTCIAADCEGEPSVFASATRIVPDDNQAGCRSDEEAAMDRAPIFVVPAAREPSIELSAWSAWSGCRALDAPILGACGVHDGFVYRFTNALAHGCNRGPDLLLSRFVELLQGLTAKDAGSE